MNPIRVFAIYLLAFYIASSIVYATFTKQAPPKFTGNILTDIGTALSFLSDIVTKPLQLLSMLQSAPAIVTALYSLLALIYYVAIAYLAYQAVFFLLSKILQVI